MSKIVCIGECLVDVTPTKNGYENRIGGAPYNVCACVARLGGDGYYLGKLGGDKYADFLLEKISQSGVKTDYISIDKTQKTALAYVALDDSGDRKFTFFRDNTADLNLKESDVSKVKFDSDDILHFCSVALQGDSLYAHKRAIKQAKDGGAIVSFDVNIRQNLWDSLDGCIATIFGFLAYADIVKVSEEELALLSSGESENELVANLLLKATNCKLLVVTKGGEGAVAYDKNLNAVYSPAIKVSVKNTTGAGDNFMGALLYKLSTDCILIESATERQIKSLLDFANAHTAKYLANN